MKKAMYLFLIGLLLTNVAIPLARRQRETYAFGGEYLLIIVPLLLAEFKKTIKQMIKSVDKE